MLEQLKNINLTPEKIEECINNAMEQEKISWLEAYSHFYLYMCSHGSIEDFKEAINYYIRNYQDKIKED